MFSRTTLHLLTASAMTLASGTLAFSGGYWLEFGKPTASNDPAAKEALALVRAVGCGEPSKSTMSASAEGLVNGERKSLPLQVVTLASPGLYAIKGQLPSEGSWVLSVTGTYLEANTGAIVPITSKGIERKAAKLSRHKPLPAEVDALLRGIAAPKQTAAR
jgi:hypothetical protein